MKHEQQLNDQQLSDLLSAVLIAESRFKSTGKSMTTHEIRSELASSIGAIKVSFLSRGDGAALTELIRDSSGADRKNCRRKITSLSKLLIKEQKRRTRQAGK